MCLSSSKFSTFIKLIKAIINNFRPKRNALFLVDLLLDSQGAHYSTNVNSFETMLVNLFDKGIQSTQNIPQLEKVSFMYCYCISRCILV
jgi:hypothetical protein